MEPRAPQFSLANQDLLEATAQTAVSGATPTVAARPALPIIALSEDPLLLEAIANAAVDSCPVITSPSADRFIDQLVATDAQLALIDAAAAPPELARFLAALHEQFPQLQLLLAGPGNVQHLVASQIADGTVFRFVHKPASAQRLKLFVDAALRQRQARITNEILEMPGPAASGPTAPSSPSTNTGGGSVRRVGWMAAAASAALLIVVAGAIIWYSSGGEQGSSTVQSVPAPAKDPALEHPPVAASSATNSPAAALAAQRAAEQDAIDRAAAERSERSEREQSRQASQLRLDQAHEYVQLAEQRIASGALVEPADDSARYYVSEAFELAPDDADVRAVSMALGEALIASFRKSLAAGDRVAAAHWLQASRDYQVADATLSQMSVQLDGFEAAQEAEAAASRAVAVVAPESVVAQEPEAVATSVTAPAPPAATPPGATAAAPATPAAATTAGSNSGPVAAVPGIIQEYLLHRSHFVIPIYPPTALAHGRTGTVEMDFTVTAGRQSHRYQGDLAEPEGMFDRESILALSHSRYEPVQRDGVAVAQRAHIRMRFKL